MSGVMNPFDTLFGVVINRFSSRRALMLPSFEATKPRSYMRRPASTISARICSSRRVFMSGAVLGAACFGTEVVGRAAGAQRQRGARRDKRSAHRVAGKLD